MPLRTWEEFQVPALTDATRPVYELLPERVGNDAAPMPPDGQISDADMQRLVQWAAAGAPASDETCDEDPEPEPEPGVGPDELPCEVTHTFTAHADGSDNGFHVPQVDNLYQCFSFSSPLPISTQITAWAPITDDERVLHHWILYRTQTSVEEGSSQQCDMPGDAAFVAGWAPGGENWIMPNDVGLEFGGPGDSYILQVHYNNVAGHDDAVDKSGVAFCTTEQPRPNTAGILWLGTDKIAIPPDANNHQVSGVCPSAATTLLPEPLTVIASFPHMHQLGRAMTTTINRLGGGSDLLVNADPFTFDNQTVYPHDPPIVVNQGDEMVTTCTFENTYGVPVYFGEDTEDEMCFNFIMAYPVQFVPGAYRKCIL